jgi:hypothetical protein
MTDELKPCPFCGSDEQQRNGHYVECCNCHASGPDLYPTPDDEKVKDYWNTRHDPEEIPEWLKTWLTETITNCELLADELMDKSVGNGTNGDIEEAVRLKRRANTFREVLSLKKPEE